MKTLFLASTQDSRRTRRFRRKLILYWLLFFLVAGLVFVLALLNWRRSSQLALVPTAPKVNIHESLLARHEDVGQVPVVRDGQILGLIGRDYLPRVIRAHPEFRT